MELAVTVARAVDGLVQTPQSTSKALPRRRPRIPRLSTLTRDQRLYLLGAGAAAGVGCGFNAPLAGVAFAREVVLGPTRRTSGQQLQDRKGGGGGSSGTALLPSLSGDGALMLAAAASAAVSHALVTPGHGLSLAAAPLPRPPVGSTAL